MLIYLIIYKVTNKVNGKIYVGQTINELSHRRRQHENSYKYESTKNGVFARAMKKYGKENFTWEVIDSASSIGELNEKEIYWIKELNTLVDNGMGYNSNKGGLNGEHSETTKRKIGDAQRGDKNHMFGLRGVDNPTSRKVLNVTDNIHMIVLLNVQKRKPKCLQSLCSL